ncbi:GlsB/YeaQ/YmgE family stress response membrane protein [Hyphomicrobium sp. NDB2Meth4]|uniref:GlsB/YeaQ/YmgE family stress response membrane protein n=1 Tax=Hyphomicrobium sp. NDB2Meth4 TaxID=1892846 RepID=UPI000930145B|nr:GlsB/YeaQ/YmgE family stress response membrane protein [Hyphomicrobium sp. NDB2Meth4]
MGVISWIVVGLIAGWLAEQISGREDGLLANLVIGIIGALVGGFVFGRLVGLSYSEGINLATIAIATGGAVLFLFIFGMMPHRRLPPPQA